MTPTTLLLLVTGCLMLQPLSTDLYLASLPHLATDFGASPAAVQQTLSLFVIGFGSAQLVSGPLSDRYGRRPVLIAGLTLYLLSSLICALAPALDWLIAARFAQAMGCCTAVVVARAIIRDAYPAVEGAQVLAKASSLLALAPIGGPILGSYLQVTFGWRAAFVVLTSAGVTMLAATLWRMQESNHQTNPLAMRIGTLASTYLTVLRTPRFWNYALPGALSYASIFVFISGSSFALICVLGVATEYYGALFAISVCGYLGGTLICRRLLNRFAIPRVIVIGATISATGALGFWGLALASVEHWSMVIAAQFLVMGAHGIIFPCAQSSSLAPFPNAAGAAAGFYGFITMVAALITGTWVGSSHDGTLMPLASISASVSCGLFACTYLLMRHEARAEAMT